MYQSLAVDDWKWLVQTQVTIGYGDIPPRSFFTYFTITISWLVGSSVHSNCVGIQKDVTNFALSLAESSLYTHIAYSKAKRRNLNLAVMVIQAW